MVVCWCDDIGHGDKCGDGGGNGVCGVDGVIMVFVVGVRGDGGAIMMSVVVIVVRMVVGAVVVVVVNL